MKKVSVVIPVYNAEKYLRQCIESIINQTLKDIEIICVDDGSTDDSLAILNEYASKDERIKVLQQKNQYAGVARNNGMSVATGEYVHFMDSDDWVEEDAYEKLYNIAKENDVDFVKFKYAFYDERTQQKYSNACSDIANIDVKYFERILNVKDNFEILAQAPDSPWSGFYNLEFLKINNCVFDNFICANDVGFFFRCLTNARNVFLSNEKFVNYRVNIATSLISRRAYHFDCQIALYEVMDRFMKDYPSEMGNIVRKILLDALFANYKKFINDRNLEDILKNDIKKQTTNFVKTVDKKLVSNRFKKLYRILKVQGLFKKVDNIKVSVIVPVYNAEKYLRQCLNSLTNQSLQNLEFICVNDGSTDNSLKILNEYAKKDSRFLVINQENSGSGQARNNALKVAKGEYIGFVDSDDIVSENYFNALYSASQNGKYDIIATSKIRLFRDGEKKTKRKHVGLRNKKYLIKDNYEKSNIILASGSTVNKIYKQSFINQCKISFIDIKSSAEDNYFTDCAIIRAKEIKIINNATYFYRENSVLQTKIEIDIKTALKAFDVYLKIIKYIQDNVSKNIQTLWIDVVKRRAKLDIYTYLFENLKIEEREEFLKLANKKFEEFPTTLVVSLTSFPTRIDTVSETIETLLNQTLKADKVILWLAEEQFENMEDSLPEDLIGLKEKGLEIKWCEDIKSYKKLIPTLKEYPNSIIVTADDDILYPKTWLNELYINYLQNPNEIQCQRANRITFDKCGNVLPYRNWIFEIFNVRPSYSNFFTGCGGVLYVQNLLDKNVLDKT